ncbi:hypothetical protein pb186bvf_004414 [Paramecium bursaria]
MLAKSVESKIDLNYDQLSNKCLQYYKKNNRQNQYKEYRRGEIRNLSIWDDYGCVDQEICLYIEDSKFIVPNILINGLHYIWKRFLIKNNKVSKSVQYSETTQKRAQISIYIFKQNRFLYDQQIEISPQNYQSKRMEKRGQKIIRIVDTEIYRVESFKLEINQNDKVPLKVKVMDIRKQFQKNTKYSKYLKDLFDDPFFFNKMAPDGNCIILNDQIINKNYNIREIPNIANIQFSKCSKFFTCICGENQFYIIEVSTLRNLFSIGIKKNCSEIFFDFKKSMLTETIKNIQYQTFIHILMESSAECQQYGI